MIEKKWRNCRVTRTGAKPADGRFDTAIWMRTRERERVRVRKRERAREREREIGPVNVVVSNQHGAHWQSVSILF